MPKSNDHLFQLINTLSESEASIFVERTLKGTFSDTYIKLFEYLQSMKSFSDSKFNSYCESLCFSNPAIAKSKLYELLLQNLDDFHGSSKKKNDIDKQIRQLEILLQRGLVEAAKKHLKKVKNRAEKIEYSQGCVKLVQFQIRIFLAKPSKDGFNDLEALHEELEMYQTDVQTENDYVKLYDQALLYARSNYNPDLSIQAQALINKLKNNPLLQEEIEFPTLRCQLLYHSIHAKLAHFDGRDNDRIIHYRENVKLWKAIPHKIEDDPAGFIKVLSNLASLLRIHHSFARQEFQGLIRDIKNINTYNYSQNIEKLHALALLHTTDVLNTPDSRSDSLLNEEIPGILLMIEEHQHCIPHSRILTLYYNITSCFFLLGKFENALEIAGRVTKQPPRDSREDIQVILQLLACILLYEQEGIAENEGEIRSIIRNISKRSEAGLFIEICLKHITALVNSDLLGLTEKIFKPWFNDIRTLIIQHPTKNFLGSNEISTWLQSKIWARSIVSIYRDNLHKKSVENSPLHTPSAH